MPADQLARGLIEEELRRNPPSPTWERPAFFAGPPEPSGPGRASERMGRAARAAAESVRRGTRRLFGRQTYTDVVRSLKGPAREALVDELRGLTGPSGRAEHVYNSGRMPVVYDLVEDPGTFVRRTPDRTSPSSTPAFTRPAQAPAPAGSVRPEPVRTREARGDDWPLTPEATEVLAQAQLASDAALARRWLAANPPSAPAASPTPPASPVPPVNGRSASAPPVLGGPSAERPQAPSAVQGSSSTPRPPRVSRFTEEFDKALPGSATERAAAAGARLPRASRDTPARSTTAPAALGGEARNRPGRTR